MDKVTDIEILRRALRREKEARKQAEQILEERSMQLYESNEKLKELNEFLENEIERRIDELTRQEEQFRHLFENNPFPMLIYDYETLQIVDLNDPAIKFYGEKSHLVGRQVFHLHPEEEQEEAHATIRRVLSGLPIEFKEWHHYMKEGQLKPVELHSSQIFYKGRKCRLLQINDITERKKIEIEKELNQKKYQDLVEGASDIIYRTDMNGDFIYANPTGVHLSGYSLEELTKMNYIDLVANDYKDFVRDFYERQLTEHETSSYLEFPMTTKAGKVIWIGQNVNLRLNLNEEWEVNALARNITDLKLARDEIERSERKYKNILENLKLGILEVDLDGKITNAYPKFTELSGYSRDELIGKLPVEFLLPAEHRGTMTRQNVIRAKGLGSVYEVEIVRKDGERRWVIISGAPFYNSTGEMVGTVGIHLDISERKRIEKELVQAKEIAENSVKIKEQFMANMSHEIRTPMNAILGMVRLLTNTSLDQRQHEYLGALSYSAENLLILINDILDFSKIESGKLEIVPEPDELLEVCENAIKIMEPKAEENGSVIYLVNRGLGNRLYDFDRARLNQVLLNLLGNAVKFTQGGEVKLIVQHLASDEEKEQFRFKVSDTGIGISAENTTKIFESFIQAEETIERKYGGTGLGLPISKSIVEMMGGSLEVKSVLGKGSEFYFDLSFKKSDLNALEKKKEVAEEKLLIKGIEVLLVEDNEINIFMAKTMLEELACKVSVARNGEESIEMIKAKKPDLILMDMRMPVLDGLGATLKIRNELGMKDVPIIALTANALKEDKDKCLEVGMNGFISKPFERNDLVKVMNMYVSLDLANDNGQAHSNYIDTSILDKVSGGNDTFKERMIQLFLKESGRELEELKSHTVEKNWLRISEIAHKLKPSIDYLGAQELRDGIREIENSFKTESPEQHLDFLAQFLEKFQAFREQLRQDQMSQNGKTNL